MSDSRPLDGMPDVTTMPNFSALGDWMVKLRSWCEHACDKINDLDAQVKEKGDELTALEEELRQQKHTDDEVEEIIEMAQDVHRGVRDFSELLSHLGVQT